MSADPAFAVVQAEWARLLLASFADAGVRHVVISPGSRSTPFVLAAAREPRLRAWDLIDERSAAFFALGKARATGVPALLLCTSGTAAANYLPAVVEAGAAEVPLLVLTADRPVELVGCGANQTIDQIKLYGDHARRFVDLGAPAAGPHALRAARRAVAQAVHACHYPVPGAVHLNARAAKPLEPREPATPAERAVRETVDEILARPIVTASPARRAIAGAAIAELTDLCRQLERGLIVCGPAPVTQPAAVPELAGRLASLTGFPLYCEPASQGRFRRRAVSEAVFADALDTLLHDPTFRSGMAPDLIVQVGRPPTSKVWERTLDEHSACLHWVIDATAWSDSRSTADRLLAGDPEQVLEALVQELSEHPIAGSASDRAGSVWTERFRQAGERAWRIAESLLDGDALSEAAVAREVVESLPEGSLLAVGNSLPIRMVDTWCRGGGKDLAVWSQRGASGIDGVISGAAGAAGEWPEPSALLIGDISFLHDLAGLAAARTVPHPFALVVVQNRGGRIFEQLPLASEEVARGEIFDHWITPHDHDLAHAAALFGLPFARATSLTDFRRELDEALARPGASVIEAAVPEHGAVEQNRALWQAVRSQSR